MFFFLLFSFWAIFSFFSPFFHPFFYFFVFLFSPFFHTPHTTTQAARTPHTTPQPAHTHEHPFSLNYFINCLRQGINLTIQRLNCVHPLFPLFHPFSDFFSLVSPFSPLVSPFVSPFSLLFVSFLLLCSSFVLLFFLLFFLSFLFIHRQLVASANFMTLEQGRQASVQARTWVEQFFYPRVGHMRQKRVRRYLRGRPLVVSLVKYQLQDRVIDWFSNSDGAVCQQTARSMSGRGHKAQLTVNVGPKYPKRGCNEVTSCGNKVVPELRLASCAKKRVVDKRLPTGVPLVGGQKESQTS